MIEIQRARPDDPWLLDPGPLWRPATMDGVRTATVTCSNGHVATICNHDIKPDGSVHPSLVCPHEGCDFHEWVKLEGWEA